MSLRRALIVCSLAAATLAGCVTTPPAGYSYSRAVEYRDGDYYVPVDEQYGDYYYAPPETEYRYDDYGYGYADPWGGIGFWRLDRYGCSYWDACWAYARPWRLGYRAPGWSFSIGPTWYYGSWGWRGHYGYPGWGYYHGHRHHDRDYRHDRGHGRDDDRDHRDEQADRTPTRPPPVYPRPGRPDPDERRGPDRGIQRPLFPERNALPPEPGVMKPLPRLRGPDGDPVRPRQPFREELENRRYQGGGPRPTEPDVRWRAPPRVTPAPEESSGEGRHPVRPDWGMRGRGDDAEPLLRAEPRRLEAAPRPEPRAFERPEPRSFERAEPRSFERPEPRSFEAPPRAAGGFGGRGGRDEDETESTEADE